MITKYFGKVIVHDVRHSYVRIITDIGAEALKHCTLPRIGYQSLA
jgi:hypothetical protein